jgi:hypothetical protein
VSKELKLFLIQVPFNKNDWFLRCLFLEMSQIFLIIVRRFASVNNARKPTEGSQNRSNFGKFSMTFFFKQEYDRKWWEGTKSNFGAKRTPISEIFQIFFLFQTRVWQKMMRKSWKNQTKENCFQRGFILGPSKNFFLIIIYEVFLFPFNFSSIFFHLTMWEISRFPFLVNLFITCIQFDRNVRNIFFENPISIPFLRELDLREKSHILSNVSCEGVTNVVEPNAEVPPRCLIKLVVNSETKSSVVWILHFWLVKLNLFIFIYLFDTKIAIWLKLKLFNFKMNSIQFQFKSVRIFNTLPKSQVLLIQNIEK